MIQILPRHRSLIVARTDGEPPSTLHKAEAMSRHWKAPAVVSDARFGAARTLVTTSHPDRAVDAFAVLLEHSIAQHGPDHVESSILYYEYGNALFRAYQRSSQEEPGDAEEAEGAPSEAEEGAARADPSSASPSASDRRRALAEAAERRLNHSKASPCAGADDTTSAPHDSEPLPASEAEVSQAAVVPSGTPTATTDEKNTETNAASSDDESKEDVLLALEMMETCWSILDQYTSSSSSSSSSSTNNTEYGAWATDQLPRVLTGIGDALSDLGRHADAADAYLRALGHRQASFRDRFDAATLDEWLTKTALSTDQQDQLLEWLVSRRKLVEVNVLIAEELLSHVESEGPDQDVVTTETKTVLVPAKERVEYARGYYESSREQLQEAVLLLGQLKAKLPDHEGLEEEKENVCFAATLVMGVGEALAEKDEGEQLTAQEPSAKRPKS